MPRHSHFHSFFQRRILQIPQNCSLYKNAWPEALGQAAAEAAAVALQGEPGVRLQADRHSHTHTHPRTLVHTHTHSNMLSLTLGWIFKLIAGWFSCKTGPGLGACGWSFQLLCSHLGTTLCAVSRNKNCIFLFLLLSH